MSFEASLGVTIVRSVTIVGVALPICLGLNAFLKRPGPWRSIGWLLLLAPAIVPRMMTGYGYANFALSLIPYPFWNEILYSVLLLISIVPIGTVLCYFAPPPPMSAVAHHCLTLLRPASSAWPGERWKHWGRRSSRYVAAVGMMLLLAFQEFELASLMGVASWSVWLFDAQAGGLLLGASLQYALPPLLGEVLVFAAVGYFAWRNAGLVATPSADKMPVRQTSGWAAWGYLVSSVMLFCGVPWYFILGAAWDGLSQLIIQPAVAKEIFAGCAFAFLAAVIAYGAALLLVRQMRCRTRGSWWLALGPVILPGLLGSLVLGLSLLFLFQSSPLHVAYGTPVPWLAGLVLFLVPRACLIALLWSVVRAPETMHLATLLSRSSHGSHLAAARDLQWRGVGALHFLALGLLFFWAYSDLTIASILAPAGLVSAPVRLYNLMHYGQSAVLSAMVVAAFGFPMLIWSLLGVFRRQLQKVLIP